LDYPVKGVAAAAPFEEVLAHALVVIAKMVAVLGTGVYDRVKGLSEGSLPLTEIVKAVVAMNSNYSPVLMVQP
jgi:hypothetical protein